MTVRTARWIPVVMLCAAVALSGCTGGTPGKGSASPTALDAAQEEAKTREKYKIWAACMRDQGVDVSDDMNAEQINNNGSIEQLKAAYAACRKVAPGADLNPTQAAADLEKRRRNAKCMRENGYPDWPDPDPNDPFLSPPAGTDMDKATEMLSTCARKTDGAK
ncbi:hypothetical protein [Dactylosporangium sp. NPDC051484]|uniref:hypothetical protein n=1 Tax=Dactylosporangium sp. NPDC051484 TaxID=3154942 RepID=UPI00344EAFA2